MSLRLVVFLGLAAMQFMSLGEEIPMREPKLGEEKHRVF